MKKLAIIATIATLSAGTSFAANTSGTGSQTGGTSMGMPLTPPADNGSMMGMDMEKCMVIDKNGRGLIKEGLGETGMNKAGDPATTIMVPKGQCDKINAGDFSGVSQEIKDKIEGAM